MKNIGLYRTVLFSLIVSAASHWAIAAESPIDRHALVLRHTIEWNDLQGQIPLGNGEFCFNSDATGLQTFGGSTLSHWGWHTNPLPEGFTVEDIPPTGTVERGRIKGPMKKASEREELRDWLFQNPHPMNLGRLRLVRQNGQALKPEEITVLARSYNLWTGLHTSRFTLDGQEVQVQTCVHPDNDSVAVRIESPLLREGKIAVMLDFPYPTNLNGTWAGDWNRPDAHRTESTISSGIHRAEIHRTADESTYSAAITWSDGGSFATYRDAAVPDDAAAHAFMLSTGDQGLLEFVCGFAAHALDTLPSVAQTQDDTARHWQRFWEHGGAIDLSLSKDPRWMELERRIVLSQYLMAVQSAGSWPSAEIGLLGICPWNGQFHMEMTWWHLAHYGLWDRWPMADKALQTYDKFLPVARQLAQQFDYKGAKWGKQVGPEGRTAPWLGSFVLHWQQPHPIFFAELEYRLYPTRQTLEKWDDIIQETAEYMADFPTLNEATGQYLLDPVMPTSEIGISRDTVFELAYWRWGLEQAQVWRQRLGKSRHPAWEKVRTHLVPLPVAEGVYIRSQEWTDTYSKRAYEHPDPIGPIGMLPPVDGLDSQTAHRTVMKVWQTWDWNRCWGWDFPWLAMAAARVGEPQIAVDALLKDNNRYDQRGVCNGNYLPGNGGLLYAVAMMAAGWDGTDKHAPGFPDDGNWVVRWEGLKQAP